jgi:hypothetical protein
MKRIIFFLTIAAAISASDARAQDTTTTCPIPCWKQSFPYIFCDLTGAKSVHCSSNPDSMGPGLIAARSKIPGCVNVIPPDTSAWYQPSGPPPPFTEEPPTPPDRETIWERYLNLCLLDEDFPPPWANPYDEDPDNWDDDPSCYDASLQQWALDSSNFLAGAGQEEIDLDGLDTNATHGAETYFDQEYLGLFYEYDNEETAYEENDSIYEADSARWAAGFDQPYRQVWNTTQADSDAQSGLNAWLAICNLKGDPTCCILIEPDNNPKNYPGQYDPTAGQRGFAVGKTYGSPGCPDGGACPPSNYRYITYNATNSFFYQNNTDAFQPNPAYTLHSSPLEGWFTGGVPPEDEYPKDQDYSFNEVVEHEEGHWLGLLHPDSTVNGVKCVNNYNDCKDSITWMLMGSGQAQQGIVPRGLGADDSCMFAKLYCPNAGFAYVEQSQEPEPPSPEIHPNPSTGAMQLDYTVTDRSFVQVGIYDELGKQVRLVSSGYEESGSQSISLGTESLPSGNYVCRVRVGDRVSYINLEIRK